MTFEQPSPAENDSTGVKPEQGLPLHEHLNELRQRIIRSLLALAAGFAVAYYFIDPIFDAVARPLKQVLPEGSSIIFTAYSEGFFAYLKLAFVCAIFLSSPIILYEIWAFIAPGLYSHEKRIVLPMVFVSSLCFIGGGVFGYFVVFPAAFGFFAGYSSSGLKLMPNITEYLSFAIHLLLAFGLAFELPVFMLLLGMMGVVRAEWLKKWRRYAILVAFVAAAILTPTPDVVNQILMAVPLILLYELGILLVWMADTFISRLNKPNNNRKDALPL
ncbi:MAG: twin-arginine translocase subunit TatC [Dissulfuribacterales bacterium]